MNGPAHLARPGHFTFRGIKTDGAHTGHPPSSSIFVQARPWQFNRFTYLPKVISAGVSYFSLPVIPLEDLAQEWYGGRTKAADYFSRYFLPASFWIKGDAVVTLTSGAGTHVGLVRTNNEDAYLAMPDTGVFALSDGMGGAAAGEIASRYFIETAQATVASGIPVSGPEKFAQIEKVFTDSNKRILEHAANNPDDLGMGCTADLLAFADRRYIIGHVGDSRVYLLRRQCLSQLTRDHSLVQLQVDQGVLTPDEARTHPRKNIILRAVGTDALVFPDILEGEVLDHDIFLLCSDGLTDMVEDSLIQRILSSAVPLQQKADGLIEAALAAGGSDNVTVVLCQVEMSNR